MSVVRTIIAITLAIFALLCIYTEYIHLLYIVVNFAACYDTYYLYTKLNIKAQHALIFLFVISSIHFHLLQIYLESPLILIKIVSISQVSDVYQFFAGNRWGISKIGWISSRKSYEGYFFGYIATFLTFLPFYMLLHLLSFEHTTFFQTVYEITLVFLLGVVSGLLSSLYKRLENIKDYSDMLGPHGGWVDRIDSIILPSLLSFMIFKI